ncbi:selenocysteine lyase-like isoform X1 [Bolinopsis microptera]|uniref:selenocysteine lyase-like isoform X1 n=1 Tax=Bolinopsis microptera TaxID=2820187 RepID=UPI0030796DF0
MVKHKVYVDNNGTTPLSEEVCALISKTLRSGWANPSSRSDDADVAAQLIKESRERISKVINCGEDEITFMSGGTECNNMVLNSISKLYSKPHIVISAVEHDSISVYARNLFKQGLITLTEVELNSKGGLEVEDVLSACTTQTRLVSIMLANNETGVMFDVVEMAGKVKKEFPGLLFHTDAAQALGKIPVDVAELRVDYLTLVGHKFYGPRIGALYHRLTAPLLPLLYGGGQESGIRPGTENTPMIAGLGLAAQLAVQGLSQKSLHMEKCRRYLEARLVETFGHKLVINCRDSLRLPNTSNFAIFLENCRSVNVLEGVQFIASKGAACHSHSTTKPSQILLNSGVSYEVAMNSIRVSLGVHNTVEDVDFIIEDLIRVSNELAQL